ncbi:hydroxyethylthiazole kinase [Curvivirga aplysinae]|uniref:hydroxyethylthiazole kinase n=1 Tax=Curvivirga aplysinae TaxID=2529852 RepID=UPI0012BB750B|nr:hydroxyethylthiazole kinase [Curvivirga aplysinae]MTI09500.1 hydroxyethylthiazole kinase [Curvivirga aplysinae]
MFEKELEYLLTQIKLESPKVHCLTNSVVQNLTANALLAVGATPSMTIDPDEVTDFTSSAHSLLVNLGTLDASRKEAILRAVEAANEQNIPWILDPVLINRAPKRLAFAKELLSLKPALIRANSLEITALNIPIGELLEMTDAVIAITGEVDEVFALDTNRETLYAPIKGGHELMAHVTGLGCAGTAVIAAYLGVGEKRFEAVCAALDMIAKAGELAALESAGPASFQTVFLDQLYSFYKRDSING